MKSVIPVSDGILAHRKEAAERKQSAEQYLGERKGTYMQRTVRYGKVLHKLRDMGLTDQHMIVDLGAGWGDFDFFLRTSGFRGRYLPVDAALDGVDLDFWQSHTESEFFVAMELLEHLHSPGRLMSEMWSWAKRGVVVTTPNPMTTDVKGMDATHRTPIWPSYFICRGWEMEVTSCFGKVEDSILGWRKVGWV